jgi:hypothetical protein
MLIRSKIYKEINEKREIVYYRINNLIDHEILIANSKSDEELIINPNIKKLIIQILKSLELRKK